MDLVQILTQNMSQYSPVTYRWVNSIVANSTRAVGLYMVGILLVLEITKIFEKANSSNAGAVTLKMFQGLAFRAALGGIMVGISSYILQFCLSMGVGFANLISQNAQGAFDALALPTFEMSNDMLSLMGDLVSAFINPTEAFRKTMVILILVVIGAFVSIAGYLMVWVIVMLRFFQLYTMLALMPIPMASFASEEHDHIGKAYIKKILAYAFQPAVIMVVFGVYHFLSSIVINLGGLISPFDFGVDVTFIKNLILGIVFVIVLWQTHKKSSELFGV